MVDTSGRRLEAVVEVRAEDSEGGVGEVDQGEQGKEQPRDGLYPGERRLIHRRVNNRTVNNTPPEVVAGRTPACAVGTPC